MSHKLLVSKVLEAIKIQGQLVSKGVKTSKRGNESIKYLVLDFLTQ